ncbi:Crp/Fnr family transcriptional regulator [Sphingomonas canadensis]|uniref:Crp/Fnr family transcriptional regulator n=1 Tax=Sphingomonas canadensis TaxID=1219257 RepID=A0ABW3HG15_9SPHN|nr:Crp/Fnr family transcriptional regulator [Sphingomonas canadensis]MCW3838191.1 Crp/Fnr family transcriptional regulator [Sphingomonas canadensis]
MSETGKSCAECAVRGEALCAALDENALAALSATGRRRRLARGESLSWAGHESAVCANLIQGMMKLTASTADGREQIVGIAYPADFVGRPFARDADVTVTALAPSELCVFPRGDFERALTGCADMERLLLRRTLETLDAARERMLMLARKTAGERVAWLLLDCARRAEAADGSEFDLPLTRGEMAELLGLTIETVSRQLTRLRARGIIATRGARGMAIRDAAALEAAAG